MTRGVIGGQLDFTSPVDRLASNEVVAPGLSQGSAPHHVTPHCGTATTAMKEGPMDDEARGILSRLDELRFQSVKRGVYAEVARRMEARLEDGEPVSGAWIMETTKAVQVQYDLVPLP